MENREYIMIISVGIVVIGWFINSYLNRKHEIFKKRLDYRLSMLESYKEVAVILEKLFNNGNQSLANKFIEKLEIAQTNFLLYGTKEEIELINKIVQYASENKHSEMKNVSANLMTIVRNNIRTELDLESI